ncbi:MAG: S8 family serine peptidase [Bacteroidaceae bacterium]|nr:S8 family serine peptidase [Bacteroidaceae bacterium]
MKKIYLFLTLLSALLVVACSDNSLTSELPDNDVPEVALPDEVIEGELLVKFVPEMSDILDETLNLGAKTRSGIPSTDEVLAILGAYSFERVFPVDTKNEERTREAGLHLWYRVLFDENTNLQEAKKNLSLLGEVSKVQCNRKIYRLNNQRPVVIDSDGNTTSTNEFAFNDPELYRQWGYINRGGYAFEKDWAKTIAGCDVGCEEAWKVCTGDPSIIVAVMDEGVMFSHPDLAANMWINEGEEFDTDKDADGNGYKEDKHGYNFATNRGYISTTGSNDSGHGTHVAGTIAAVNNNGMGVCGIAGGDVAKGESGVKIMSCQIFDDNYVASLMQEARAVKYAADNGATILQCSWGYMSPVANPILGFTPGPATDKEWETMYPLEKEAFDYFINNAGSPNGVIDGGIVVFAAGNEFASEPSYPGAYSKFICVSALAADYTPATYTDYGAGIDLSAPGGDGDYYGAVGDHSDSEGMIYSTLVVEGKPSYGYYEGSSMACPHVSGVAALGLSYAAKLRRHFKAEEFIELMYSTATDLDHYFTGEKLSHYNHSSPGALPTKTALAQYVGKMGKLSNAAALLNAIADAGSSMKIPNIYISPERTATIDLAQYFVNGEALTYAGSVADESVATVSVLGTKLNVTGVKKGATQLTVTTADGTAHTVAVVVREGANENGWM